MSTRTSLWAFTLTIAALALGAYPLLVGDYGPYTWTDLGAGLILLAASPIAELLVVHVPFRKNAHSFSLLELPLVAGVMTVQPLLVVLAYGLGGGAVLLAHRRQPPLKFIFNTSTFVLTATVAVWLFRTVPHPASVTAPASWLAAALATFAASSLGTLLVFAIISVAERRLVLRNLWSALCLGLATASGGVSLGIACAMLASESLPAVLFVTTPLVAVFIANRAYESERQRRQNLQLVYDTSRTLTEEPESEQALFGALSRCVESLAGDFATLCLPQGRDLVVSLRVDETGRHRWIEPMKAMEPLLAVAAGHNGAWHVSSASADSGTAHPDDVERPLLALTTGGRRPVEALVSALVAGDEDVGLVVVGRFEDSFRPFGENEIALFETVCRGVASHAQLTRQANQDALTGLPNRRRLFQRLESAYDDGTAPGLAILLIDLDDFKGINDTFGHAVGDAVLSEVGHRIQLALSPGWMVARLGGDEFAVVGDAVGRVHWTDVAHAALDAFVDPIATPGGVFPVRLSMGAALGSEADSPAVLLRNADTALYEAKRLGKGQLQAYSEPMFARAARRYRVAERLRAALAHDETTIVVQPVVRLHDGKIVAAEALSRWTSPDLGEVFPGEFVPVAEENGLCPKLTRSVIARAVAVLASCPGSLTLSLNVSPADLAEPSVVDALKAAAAHVRPHTIGIEVTERIFVADVAVLSVLADLRRAGLPVYIDDFGTGYSSLAYLKDMPADFLKVPRELVCDIAAGSRSLAVVDAVVSVGRALGLEVVAEGVETVEQERLLRGLGVGYAQGYLFERPLAVRSFVDLMSAQTAATAA